MMKASIFALTAVVLGLLTIVLVTDIKSLRITYDKTKVIPFLVLDSINVASDVVAMVVIVFGMLTRV